MYGDGLDHKHLLNSKGSGADITTGTVQVLLPHIEHVPINLLSLSLRGHTSK